MFANRLPSAPPSPFRLLHTPACLRKQSDIGGGTPPSVPVWSSASQPARREGHSQGAHHLVREVLDVERLQLRERPGHVVEPLHDLGADAHLEAPFPRLLGIHVDGDAARRALLDELFELRRAALERACTFMS